VTDERPVAETLLDYLVYAPLGAAVVVAEELPRLAERGRDRFQRQMGVAELVGRVAVAQARRRFAPPSSGPVDPVRRSQTPSSLLDAVRDDKAAASPSRATQRSLAGRDAEPAKASSSRATARWGQTTTAEELPIPAYDTLAASQVVERLPSLSAAELEAVHQHESATRRRRTVLHRIAQLNAERDGSTA
jgi:hypothetical protein